MVPLEMFPEGTVLGNGTGPAVRLESARLESAAGCPLQLTLTIRRMMERHILDVSVWGSPDGNNWGSFPLTVLPHRYYCGVYQHWLDMTNHPHVRYLRLQYELTRLEPGAPCRPVQFSAQVEMAPEYALAAGAV